MSENFGGPRSLFFNYPICFSEPSMGLVEFRREFAKAVRRPERGLNSHSGSALEVASFPPFVFDVPGWQSLRPRHLDFPRFDQRFPKFCESVLAGPAFTELT
jgi:hypothetical protein